MRRLLFTGVLAALPLCGVSNKTAVVGSLHDLTAGGTSLVKTLTVNDACMFCHTPHNSSPVTPLWDHTLSTATYTTYTSSTYTSGVETPAAGSSKLCLSCHDGTVAVGLTINDGQVAMTGSMASADVLTSNLTTSHPVSMTPANDGMLVSSLFATPPATKDAAVKLVSGKVECTTCHDPHMQNIDPAAGKFLVRSNSGGTMCLACHDPTQAQPNLLAGWTTSSHAIATNTVPVSTVFGAYANVAANACSSCHGAHDNATGARSLKAVESAGCAPCHSGANASPALLNVMGEFTKTYVHPTLTVVGAHDAAETLPVNSTRHAACADCHNSHTAYAQTTTAAPPNIENTMAGTSGYDTSGPLRPAVKEYQVCFKCHADSTNKPATSVYGRTAVRYPPGPLPAGDTPQPPVPPDQYNLRLKFTSTIGHNVMGNSIVTTANTTLRPYMLNINGANILARPLATTSLLYCTDCHNNNLARSINGTGPNGPHGSTFIHLLQFAFFQEPLGGGGGNSATASALCNKCHNLTTLRNVAPHDAHSGYGCTTCHDPHGVIGGNVSANHAMLNFDTSIVTSTGTYFGSYYTSASKGCYLTCHGDRHNGRSYND